ncbi:MAG: NAD-dependent epimerase/dehydratase family protein [Planctomycetes bacterium]|nr:NAD-dependent epimerase/dehydratase family protein [Planctomycetota bacterium]
MKPHVLVTGATGFVGAALVAELLRREYTVHALARPSSDRSAVDGSRVHWRDGDLVDAPSVERAVARVCERSPVRPLVIHAGAVISYQTRDRALQERVNVGGTRNVLEACRRHGVGRVLHVSSVVTVGHARADELLDEDAPYNGAELACAYTDTKRAAEELALGAAGELDLVVVNPGAIFGGGARGPNTLKFLRQIAHGPRLPYVPPGSLSVVGVEDVVAGCLLALERGARGRRYLLTESVWRSIDSFRVAAEVLGVPPPRWPAPRALWRAVGLGSALVDIVAPPKLLTPTAVRMLGAHFRFDARRARAELGWSPRPFVQVLRETVEWMRARRLI